MAVEIKVRGKKLPVHVIKMKQIFYFLSLSLILTNCGFNTNEEVGTCCEKSYTNIDSALICLRQSVDGHGTAADERVLLIAFVNKGLVAKQELGWDIINDPEIRKIAKRNYALIILSTNQDSILNRSCTSEKLKTCTGKNFFTIANQALCMSNAWTMEDNKNDIINKIHIGNGP